MKKYYSFISLLFAGFLFFTCPNLTTYAENAEPTIRTFSEQPSLNKPQSIFVQQNGHLLVVDSGNHRIYSLKQDGSEIFNSGQINGTDLYGLPIGGYLDTTQDKAFYNHPYDIVVDSKGIIYISDFNNHSIRKIVNGVVYTHAGTGKPGYKNGSKSEVQFNFPTGLALDADDNLYVADTLNHVIRKVTPNGTVSTFAGSYSTNGGHKDGAIQQALFNEPTAITLDEDGHLYISDSGNHVIRYIKNNVVTTFAGAITPIDSETGYLTGGYQNGVKEQALFYFPGGLHYEKGYLFIADSSNHRVRVVTPEGITLNLVGQATAGDTNGDLSKAQLNEPSDVHYANGTMYITDSSNHKIKAITLDLTQIQGVLEEDELPSSTPFTQRALYPQVWMDSKLIQFQEDVPYRENEKLYIPIYPFFEQSSSVITLNKLARTLTVTKDEWSRTFPVNAPSVVVKNQAFYIEASSLQKITNFSMVEDTQFDGLIFKSTR